MTRLVWKRGAGGIQQLFHGSKPMEVTAVVTDAPGMILNISTASSASFSGEKAVVAEKSLWPYTWAMVRICKRRLFSLRR